LTINESRFDKINKTPSCVSNFKRAPCTQFKKQLTRPENLFGKAEHGCFYDPKKEFTMKKLSAGIPILRKV
jgi:hypothetical protein